MSSVVISGDSSGAITLAAPSVAGTNTITLPAATGTVQVSGNMPAFSVTPTTQQNLTAATTTQVVVGTKVFDTAGAFNNTGSTVTLNGLSVPAYAFMPPVAGYYQINFAIFNNSSGNNPPNGAGYIYKTGSIYRQFQYGNYVSGSQSGQSCTGSIVVYLNGTTDYIQLYTYSESGGSGTYYINTGSRFEFSGSMIRGA